jgi:hypothetical protein
MPALAAGALLPLGAVVPALAGPAAMAPQLSVNVKSRVTAVAGHFG